MPQLDLVDEVNRRHHVHALANSYLFWILILGGLPVIYLLPTIVGAVRQVQALPLVFLFNLIGAPTGIGWIGAMILALSPRRAPAPPKGPPIPLTRHPVSDSRFRARHGPPAGRDRAH